MPLTGIRKAAMLLVSLDAATASDLLKGQPQEVVQEIAMELSQLDASGQASLEAAAEVASEFCTSLQQASSGNLHVKSFINTLLKGTAGREKAAQLHAEMKKAIRDKDPFIAISSASAPQIAAALDGEPPQAIALVLSQLPPKISTEIISRFDKDTSLRCVWRMTKPGEVSPKTMRRIGEMICRRIVEMTSDDGRPVHEEPRSGTLRKVALVLSGLDKEKRDMLLDELGNNDEDIGKTVKALMVTWEDITKIENRSLQEFLRKVDASVLAKALFGAEPAIAEKIRSNISERAGEMVDEETSLMSEPRKKEILTAREEVVKPLREANEAEELVFIEED